MTIVIPIGWIIASSLVLSFVAAIGVNLQKLSLNKEEQRPDCLRRSPYLQPCWLLGTILIVLDAVGDFIFVGLAPQSVLAPLAGLWMGWNIVLAPIFDTGEKVTPAILGATAVVYAGTILAVINAADEDVQYDLSAIVKLFKAPGFAVYMGMLMFVVFVLFLDGLRRGERFVHFCVLAGAFGGTMMLFAKCSSEILLHAVISGDFTDWKSSFLPYFFVVGTIFFAFAELEYFNKGLAKFETLLVVPVYMALWTIFGITSGMVFFQEYKGMTQKELILYVVGNCICLVGVTIFVLLQKRQVAGIDADTNVDTLSKEEEGRNLSQDPGELGKALLACNSDANPDLNDGIV